ncbi:hypothetical protein FHG87_006926 [Trinorchestia longiramus]|nr:hypothetical protein FHG87_006926 [Trinorchestia longiramus]
MEGRRSQIRELIKPQPHLRIRRISAMSYNHQQQLVHVLTTLNTQEYTLHVIQCALLTGVCTAHRSVHCSQECALLAGVCTARRSVHCSQECALLAGVCTARRSVHCSQECALLAGVCTARRSMHCTLQCALLTSTA